MTNLRVHSLTSSAEAREPAKKGHQENPTSQESQAQGFGQCELLNSLNGKAQIESYPHGKLSALWTYEYTGADLAIAHFKDLVTAKKMAKRPSLVILDSKKDNHISSVQAIIERSTLSPSETWREPLDIQDVGGQKIDLLYDNLTKTLDSRLTSKKQTDIINFSLVSLSACLYEKLEDFSSTQKTLSVQASGNNGFGDMPQYYSNAAEKCHANDMLFVGSISPSGFVSSFSTGFNRVDIAAPSDGYASARNAGDFSGTSGAAPLVSGALLHAKALLPDLDVRQARRLLAITAIPTPNAFFIPRHHGAGMLNSYGALKAAERIQSVCGKSPAQLCFAREAMKIEKERALKPATADEILEDAKLKFACPEPHSEFQLPGKYSCEELKKTFDSIRRAAFSSPTYGPYWNAISCVHAKLNFDGNAKFYRLLAESNPLPQNSKDQVRLQLRSGLIADHSDRFINNLNGLSPTSADYLAVHKSDRILTSKMFAALAFSAKSNEAVPVPDLLVSLDWATEAQQEYIFMALGTAAQRQEISISSIVERMKKYPLESHANEFLLGMMANQAKNFRQKLPIDSLANHLNQSFSLSTIHSLTTTLLAAKANGQVIPKETVKKVLKRVQSRDKDEHLHGSVLNNLKKLLD